MPKINFLAAAGRVNIRNKKKVREIIASAFLNNKVEFNDINIIFCSDSYLLKINQQYLNHDFYTDVITFNLSEKNEPVIGEIYVSTDRIKENAKSFKISYQNELLRVIIHGVLHLCGYEDKSKLSKEKMRQQENLFLKLFPDSRET